ncbi:hypothetical protein ES707_03377 [subsurface metagenome]
MSVENPEFQKALKEACDNQWGNWLYGGGLKKSSKRDVEKDLERIQQIKQDAQMRVDAAKRKDDELRRLHSPSLRRITENYKLKYNLQSGGLVCPKCGDPDYNNKMNGKPWCFKCNIELISTNKITKWIDIGRGNMDSVYRKLRGLPE